MVSTRTDPRPASRRAGILADRIEQGAAKLAGYVDGLSEAQWLRPVSATDRRTVGVVVHHVAYIYPIEIEAARAIAKGRAVETAWPAIAELNARHAAENASVTKAEAPFGLSDSAPLTAQYVIEEHALRHAWHHLARIREAVDRS